MLDILYGLRLVIKRRHTNIDNAIFRFHWFLTSSILVSFSLIITARQYVGKPIECHSTDKIPETLLNSYCWVQNTFTVPQACNLPPRYPQVFSSSSLDIPYPCIDNTRGREIKLIAYYQWVGIVLFIQGVMFHLPYYLWKIWESGLIKAILQLWATNKFFDGNFLSYGLDVIKYASISNTLDNIDILTTGGQIIGSKESSTNITGSSPQQINQIANKTATKIAGETLSTTNIITKSTNLQEFNHKAPTFSASNIGNQIDPMTFIFPRMTKCAYYDFGSSGDVAKHDALCLLPLNVMNEKIYIALWFWFVLLAILTILVIFYRILAFCSRTVRCKGLSSRCKFSSDREIQLICNTCDVGDWFLLYMVAENLDPLVMRELITAVAFKIRLDAKACELVGDDVVFDSPASANSDAKRDLQRLLDSRRPSMVTVSDLNVLSQQSTNANNQNNELFYMQPSKAGVRKLRKRLYSRRLWSTDLNMIRNSFLSYDDAAGNNGNGVDIGEDDESGECQQTEASAPLPLTPSRSFGASRAAQRRRQFATAARPSIVGTPLEMEAQPPCQRRYLGTSTAPTTQPSAPSAVDVSTVTSNSDGRVSPQPTQTTTSPPPMYNER